MANKQLQLHEYSDRINLYQAYQADQRTLPAAQEKQAITTLLNKLAPAYFPEKNYQLLDDVKKRSLLHAALNTLPPGQLSEADISLLDRLLQTELQRKLLTDVSDIAVMCSVGDTAIGLFQGDISTLKIDAIVNAANKQMLGCFQPLHKCIDNAIHSCAGVQLRDDCALIMELQGQLEVTGSAKITRAYNLPSKYVVHTVGPIVNGQPDSKSEQDLANAYTSCLDVCSQIERIKSLAFCCISTGVFGYPQQAAAQVAYATVINWLKKNPDTFQQIIFNVFTNEDARIYSELLSD